LLIAALAWLHRVDRFQSQHVRNEVFNPTATATEEIDLVQTCAWVSRLESAERVYAFSQMEWTPDYIQLVNRH